MPTKQQLESALRNAHNAGDTAAAKQLANALKGGQYDDATPEQEPIDTTGMTRQERRRAARESRPEPVDVFAGLPQETKDRIIQETRRSGRGSGAVPAMRKRLASLEQLRQVNPVLADEIENMDGVEAALIGAGGSVQNLMDGVERLLGTKTADEVKKPHLEALKNIRSSAELGEILGEAGMFAIPGSAANRILKTSAGRAGGGAALGASEGNLMARGQGATGGELILPTVVGGLAGSVSPEVAKTISKPFKKAADFVKPKTKPKTATQGPAPANVKQQQIKDKIANMEADADTAGFRINSKGVLVKDPLEKKVLDQGWSPEVTPVIKAASPADRAKMKAMVNVYQRGKQNLLERVKRRPAHVLGESIMTRYKRLADLNKRAGSQIDEVAQKTLNKDIDFSPAIANFRSALEKEGITVNNDWTLDFLDSNIEFKPAAQRLLNQTIQKMKRGTSNGVRAHKIKQFIREQLDFDSTGQSDFSSRIESVLKKLTSDIDGVLDGVSPAYDKVNKQFADTRNAMSDFEKAVGSKFDPNSLRVNDFVGMLARRLGGNAVSRDSVYTALTALEEVGEQYGKAYSDDVLKQFVFIEEMERLLGPSAFNSLYGEVDKAAQRAVEAASGNATGLIMDAAKAVGRKLQGKSEQGAIDKMKAYLESFAEAA